MGIAEKVQAVKEGNEYALKALAELKSLNNEVKTAIQEIEELAIREASNYGEKSFKDYGYRFEIREGSKRYDFSEIDEWKSLTAQIKQKEAIYKSAASAYDKGVQMFDDTTGEQIPIPKVKYSKSSVVIKKLDA